MNVKKFTVGASQFDWNEASQLFLPRSRNSFRATALLRSSSLAAYRPTDLTIGNTERALLQKVSRVSDAERVGSDTTTRSSALRRPVGRQESVEK